MLSWSHSWFSSSMCVGLRGSCWSSMGWPACSTNAWIQERLGGHAINSHLIRMMRLMMMMMVTIIKFSFVLSALLVHPKSSRAWQLWCQHDKTTTMTFHSLVWNSVVPVMKGNGWQHQVRGNIVLREGHFFSKILFWESRYSVRYFLSKFVSFPFSVTKNFYLLVTMSVRAFNDTFMPSWAWGEEDIHFSLLIYVMIIMTNCCLSLH